MKYFMTENEIMRTWKGDPSNPIVSICCITYNHEKYIRGTIEGFLIQKTEFPFEIVIHDDASTDNTAKILKNYAEQYPKLIFPIWQEENQYSRGVKIYPSCVWPKARGKYIALCEGDDHWIDSRKLQNQMNFIEKNKDYIAVTENSIVRYDDGREILFSKKPSRDIKIEEVIKNRQFATASILFRNCIKFPVEFNGLIAGDTPLFILLLQKGKLKYFNRITSIYSRGKQGVTYNFNRKIGDLEKLIIYYRTLDSYLNHNFKSIFKDHIAVNYLDIAKVSIKSKNFGSFFKNIYLYLKTKPNVIFTYLINLFKYKYKITKSFVP
ncbi:glycosyltransferase, family II [Desulfosarcina variabilis str. Montpellier]